MTKNIIIMNVLLCIFIIFIFIVCLAPIIIGIYLKDVKKNWNKYRCSPFVMPFAGFLGEDTTKNLIDCVGGMQSASMPKYTAPLIDDQTSLIANMDFQSTSLTDHANFIKRARDGIGKKFSLNHAKMGGVTSEFTKTNSGVTSQITKLQ